MIPLKNKKIAVVGAGLSGAVIAHELALKGCRVELFESRSHLAGNCYTERDAATGIMLHTYGPHIFHTSNERVWNYVRQFGEFVPFVNRVKAISKGRIYSLPINLLTINTFFGKTLSPHEARVFLQTLGDLSITEPKSFEEQALRFLGKDLYEAFFKGYTQKQWGLSPSSLPASILKRLPVRFNYDDNYYSSTFQGIPKEGYTALVAKILDHPSINVSLNHHFRREQANNFDHTFYTGPLDAWFGYIEGRLRYRTLDFALERHEGDYQGNAVINYCDPDIPWTRITEHKYFTPWETHEKTIVSKEYSRACTENDIPYYPIRLLEDQKLLTTYVTLAYAEKSVTFLGRLATYRYIDMHVAIAEALNVAEAFIHNGANLAAFLSDPLI